MSCATNQRLQTLYEKYHDQEFAANATKEVEQMRQNAFNSGVFVTAFAFGANELARMTLRTRKHALITNSSAFSDVQA